MTFNIVADKDRSAFPGKHFGNHIFDITVFDMADRLIVDYTGGYWDYVETDTGVAFMKLGNDSVVLSNLFSGEPVEADAMLAGMIVTSYAMLCAIEKGQESLIENYDRLKDAIVDYCSETNQMNVWMTIMD